MPGSRPQPLVLRDSPAAVLLLGCPPVPGAGGRPGPGGPSLLAADREALTLTGSAPGELPADLAAFCRAAGFGDPALHRAGGAAGDGPWARIARGEAVPGELLPGGLWLTAAPLPGHGTTLVVIVPLEPPVPAPGARPLAPRCGTVLSSVRASATGGRDVVVEWADPGYTRTTGIPAAEVVGSPCHRLLPARDDAALALLRDAALARLRDGVEEGAAATCTVLDQRADGSSFLHRVRATALRDGRGVVRHVVSWHTDVTACAAAEAAVERTRAARRSTDRGLDLLRALDAVVAEGHDEVDALRSAVALLAEHVGAGALVALTTDRPGGPRGVDAEVVAAAGELTALVGSTLPRRRGPRPEDPLLARRARARPQPLRAGDVSTPSGWLASLLGADREAVVVPLVGREDVVGLLVVLLHPAAPPGQEPGPEQEQGWGEADVTVVVGAARRAGLLVENARLHAREHALAERLQRSMLPEQVEVDGLDVWTFYASNAGHAQAGGDWYDVLQTADHVVGVVIGDVVGHDVEAAAAMGQIRSVVRSYAHELDDPGSVLMRVDQLVTGMRIPRMASLVYATLQRLDDGGWEMAWSSAGHLPPLLRRGTGDGPRAVEVLSEATGTLVGLAERPRPTRERALSPGDVLVFYTDGLIEERSRPMRDGLEALVDVLANSRALDAAGIGEELLQGLGESPEDDTALVVVRVPGDEELTGRPLRSADTPRRRRWQLASEPASIGRARHATLRACAVWGLPCGPQAEIVVSELVANAVLHGWGPVGLRLFDLSDALRIEVEDDSPEEPQVVQARPDGAGGHGMRLVASLGRWGTLRTRRGKIVWVELPATPAT